MNGVLVGIVSHGHPDGCNQEDTYDVFTSVADHIGWLNETILQHGGMSACDYVLAIEPSNGMSLVTPATNPYHRDGCRAGGWERWVINSGIS